jgi:hypothetical protein
MLTSVCREFKATSLDKPATRSHSHVGAGLRTPRTTIARYAEGVSHNNAAWGIIRQGQKMQFDFEMGTGLEETDYAAIARGFDCHGETVTRAQDLAPALQRAFASGLPAAIDCRTRFVPHPAMPMFGSMNRYGFDALTHGIPRHEENSD